MDNLPLAQEFNHVADFRVVTQAQNVVIGDTGFLLGGQIFGQIGNGVALDGHAGGRPGETGRRCGIDAGGVIQEIRGKCTLLNLFIGQIAGQLVHDTANHLQMAQLFGTDIRQQTLQLRIRHGITLAQIAQRSAQFAIRSTLWHQGTTTSLGTVNSA